jgi:hypothetical protein
METSVLFPYENYELFCSVEGILVLYVIGNFSAEFLEFLWTLSVLQPSDSLTIL